MIHRWLNEMQVCQAMPVGGTNAGRVGDWIDMRHYNGVVFIIEAEVGSASDDIALNLQEAHSTSGGTGARVLIPRVWYRKQAADVSGVKQYTAVAPAGASGTCTIEGSHENIVAVEVDASELDVENGFRYVRLQHNAGGSANKLLGAVAIAIGPKQATAPEHLPSARG